MLLDKLFPGHDLFPNQSNDYVMTENLKVIECVISYQEPDWSNLTLFKKRKIISIDLNGTLHKIIRTIRDDMYGLNDKVNTRIVSSIIGIHEKSPYLATYGDGFVTTDSENRQIKSFCSGEIITMAGTGQDRTRGKPGRFVTKRVIYAADQHIIHILF